MSLEIIPIKLDDLPTNVQISKCGFYWVASPTFSAYNLMNGVRFPIECAMLVQWSPPHGETVKGSVAVLPEVLRQETVVHSCGLCASRSRVPARSCRAHHRTDHSQRNFPDPPIPALLHRRTNDDQDADRRCSDNSGHRAILQWISMQPSVVHTRSRVRSLRQHNFRWQS